MSRRRSNFYIPNRHVYEKGGSIFRLSSEQEDAVEELNEPDAPIDVIHLRSVTLLRAFPDDPHSREVEFYIKINGRWYHLFKIHDPYPSQPRNPPNRSSTRSRR